uniref:Neural cell expressed, developmentally down-regulated 1 n=1 Tax=Callorhinchus milii TaxID=7868 RepID=V9KN66_CALMI
MEEILKLVSAGDCIQIWNLLLFSPDAHFNPHTSGHEVSSLSWNSNNRFLVSAASSGDRICVSSCKTKPVLLHSFAEQRGQTCVSLNSESDMILSGGADGSVNIWNMKTNKLHKSYKGHRDAVTCLVSNWSDRCILSGSRFGQIILHNSTTAEINGTFCSPSQQAVNDVQVCPWNQALMGSALADGSVVLWDLNTLQLRHSFTCVHKAPASALRFSPVNELLMVSVGLDKQIVNFDIRSRIALQRVRTDSPLTAFEFLPNGTTLLVGSSQGKISLYDFRNMGYPVKVTKAHESAVRCIKLQNVRGKFQAGQLTSSNKVKQKASCSLIGTDCSVQDVNILLGGRFSNFTPNPHLVQLGKRDFLSRSSLGEIFSPIRSDLSSVNTSSSTEDTISPKCPVSKCCPRSEAGGESNGQKLGFVQSVVETNKGLELLSKAHTSTEDKSDQEEGLRNCNLGPETIDQTLHPKTVADSLKSLPAMQSGTTGQRSSLVKPQILKHVLEETFEKFSEARHQEMSRLQLGMIHEFQLQEIAIGEAMFEHFAVRDALLEELAALRKENKRLKMFH